MMKHVMAGVAATALVVALTGAANAASVTYSGTDLSGLQYVPNGTGGVAQYDAAGVLATGAPAVAHLSTTDAGVNGAAPAVFVVGPMGTLSSFIASYHLYSESGETSVTTPPYWNIKVGLSGGPTLFNIISMDGPTLDSSSLIHAMDANWASVGTWGMTLSAFDALTYGTGTIGDLTVNRAGVEIGNWANGTAIIPASANIESITVPAAVPLPASAGVGFAMLAGFGTLFAFRKRLTRQPQIA